jgi:hypothetical protein
MNEELAIGSELKRSPAWHAAPIYEETIEFTR